MLAFLKRLFGTAQDRILNRYRKIVGQINTLEESLQKLSDDEVRLHAKTLRERAQKENLDELLSEAYALVKNVCRRLVGQDVHVSGYNQKWDMIPYDVQMLGAIALHYGYIAEMQTGEGKTLTGTIPLFLNALKNPVHIVTVNDYLAKRDCEWMGTVFRWLGLTTGVLQQSMDSFQRKEVYACDIVYGTASEFGFDYLRDNSIAMSKEEQVQRGHYFALIDEIDSILIDEARTPLIISGPSQSSKHMFDELRDIAAKVIQRQKDFCNKIAIDAKKVLEKHLHEENKVIEKFSDEEQHALRQLWKVAKGSPQNKVLKRLKEHPDIRANIDKWDLYFYAEQNQEEKIKELANLFIIVDEKADEYELTDKGIQLWQECGGNEDDFVMLDLGHEYAKVDAMQHQDEEKIQTKLALQEEDAKRKERAHNLRQLLRAHLLLERDIDYIVQAGKVIIIDENTGRPQPGRRFSDGLHQAIEAKEQVPIQKETQTFATITLQNYFRMYKKIAGMTGTAITEAQEFKDIYKLNVLEIPPHKVCRRVDHNDEMYMTEREKYAAILKEVEEIHKSGRPILLGTESVEVSEKLSRIFKLNKLTHTVLNAKNHAKEAEIIAEAGQRGAITIATNMAGRGTDIKLGSGIADVGGLHVIGSTRHQSRRIDRQLRGRSGRQGDPGSSKFYLSLEDPLMRLFASPSMTALLQRFRPPEGEPISARVLNKSIETAQKRIEGRNSVIRKHTLEYDDVMNRQRQEIYAFRNDVLHSQNVITLAESLLKNVCTSGANMFFTSKTKEGGWNAQGFCEWLMYHFPISFEKELFDDDFIEKEAIIHRAADIVLKAFHEKLHGEEKNSQEVVAHIQKEDTDAMLNHAIRMILLQTQDRLWQEHLLAMDHLRTDVHLRSVGQKDPLMEFKQEAFRLFEHLMHSIGEESAQGLFKFHIIINVQEPSRPRQGKTLKLERDRSLSHDFEGETEEA